MFPDYFFFQMQSKMKSLLEEQRDESKETLSKAVEQESQKCKVHFNLHEPHGKKYSTVDSFY